MEIKIYCAYTKLIDPTSLIPNPRNPNKHPDKQIELLAKIITAQGWRAPITVSKRSGFVVRGHGRLLAALKIETDKVPVDMQDYANEAEEWADLIADNRIAELADTSNEQLKELLDELKTLDIDLELTGFDANELGKIYAIPEYIDLDDEGDKEKQQPQKETYHCPKCGFKFEV
jgi:ParB-like chromosome segregation protein Spo0J